MNLEHSPARAGDAPAGHAKDNAPVPDRIIDEHECEVITNLSRTTRWRLMRRDEFPAKIRLSPKRGGWWLSSVLNWLAEREAA